METTQQLMEDLRYAETDKLRDEVVAQLLAVLKKHPGLVHNRFYFEFNYMTSLQAFVEKGVGLESIKTMCELTPHIPRLLENKSQVLLNLNKGDYPLHAAIRSGAPEDVRIFLIQQHPEVLNREGLNGKTSNDLIVEAAQREQQYGTLEALLDLAPSCTAMEPILQKALEHSFPANILDHIVARTSVTKLHIREVLSFDQIKIICKLLSQLQSFGLGHIPNSNGFMYLLRELQKAEQLTKLRYLQLPLLAGLSEAQQREMTKTLQEFLQDSVKLDSVRFNFLRDNNTASRKLWCHACIEALSKNRGIRSFYLDKPFSYASRTRNPDPAFVETKQACLKMLQSRNLSLTTCKAWEDCDERIKHYAHLNRHGRAEARDASASEMVNILFRMTTRRFWSDDSFLEESMAYGLLRETPGSWSRKDTGPSEAQLPPPKRQRKRARLEYSRMAEHLFA